MKDTTKTAVREIGRATLRNAITITSALAIGIAAAMFATTPGVDLYRDGRLTDLGCYALVAGICLGFLALLPWAKAHDERHRPDDDD